jgi:hypothetical protein
MASNPYNRGIIKGHSPLADTKRGKANSIYLFGEQGVASVDELWYDDCLSRFGFPFEQHQAIVERCREFLEDWCRPDINPKNVRASFCALETDVTPDVFVDWYTHLCYDLKRYDVCLICPSTILSFVGNMLACVIPVLAKCAIWPWVRPFFPFWIGFFHGIMVSLWIAQLRCLGSAMTVIGFYL